MNKISEIHNNNDEMLEMLACGAVTYKMYIVVNMGEVVECDEEEVCFEHIEKFKFCDVFRPNVCMRMVSTCSTQTLRYLETRLGTQ